jgi:hypothetical protein
LVTIRFLILVLGLEMAGIVPPFGFEFRMRKMILRKREGSPWKGPLEALTKKMRRGYGKEE